VTRNGEQLAYGYDGGFLTADTRSGLLNQGIAYVYNNDFRVAAISYAGGTEALTYDADGLLTGAGGFTITRSAQNGLPEGVTDGTLAATRTFNGFGEAAGVAYQVGGAPRYSYTLSRDPAGRITRKVETFAGVGVTLDYTYDANGRLRETRKDGLLVEVYGYDVNGNRIQETNTFKGLVNQPHTHSVEDHLLTAGAVSYQFDVDGFINRKTNGAAVTGYQYSSRGELLRVDLPGGAIIEFVHDPLGRRIAKKKNGVIVEKYLWRDATSLLAVYDGADSLSQRFLYAEDRVPVAMTRNGQTYYLLYDQLGSLRAVVDAAGAVVKRVDYDSYGYIISDSAPEFSVPFGFAGGLHDPDVGLIRFGARDYDPLIGRWTAKDPIDFGGGDTNLFGYVGGDPVRKIDPLGLVAELCTRIFFPYVIPYARHCFIRFNGNNFDTLSFDPSGVHQDPAPNWWPRSCQQTLGPQDDDCVKKEMQKCRGDQYSFLGFNCCHCAEQALKGCGLGLPSNGWPNWPINPGPQPGEMGYRP
jgi:RHS repeat-associated protein